MSKIFDAMAIFPIYGQFMVILPPPTSKKPLKIPPGLGLKLRQLTQKVQNCRTYTVLYISPDKCYTKSDIYYFRP